MAVLTQGVADLDVLYLSLAPRLETDRLDIVEAIEAFLTKAGV